MGQCWPKQTKSTQVLEATTPQEKFFEMCRKGEEVKKILTLIKSPEVDINSQDEANGLTGLMIAVQEGNEELVKALIETENIDGNVRGGFRCETAFSMACRLRKINQKGPEVFNLLLSNIKVSPSIADSTGVTPLQIAVTDVDYMAVKSILSTKEVDLNQGNFNGDDVFSILHDKEKHITDENSEEYANLIKIKKLLNKASQKLTSGDTAADSDNNSETSQGSHNSHRKAAELRAQQKELSNSFNNLIYTFESSV